ncbi:amidohydrolase family protein [Devosia sp. YIM 151766]|uniref:N-acetylglucosamine-6-phosphate deacetylase n=1 Tax=Devosia sp. YIM 151766 TaxID=3017325 RepID=UPI00255C2B56|nr:amidohydrolase family protein [Devosia sp. YIM 151766]WIY52081.1 amidohydrolase family protein [Devosia sp. YIM 151766]
MPRKHFAHPSQLQPVSRTGVSAQMSERGELVGRAPENGQPLRVTYDNGLVTTVEVAPASPCPDNLYIAPGLIDLQVNGYAGVDINAAGVTSQNVIDLVRVQRQVGTLCFLPTLVTASREDLLAGLSSVAEARRADPQVAHAIPAIHVEGPWISPQDGPRGAHPIDHVRPPSIEEFDAWQAASGGLVGLVTLSPHWTNSAEIIAYMVARGVIVSIGHTAASEEDIQRAADAGATMSTHLGNGIALNLPRHPNPIWAQLDDDRLTACLIADGFHIPGSVFRSMLRAKQQERVVLVSDSVASAGLKPGRYRGVGGELELTPEGRLGIVGTSYLAGSGMNLAQCVAIATQMAAIALDEALALATRNPGHLLGQPGRIAVGSPADLITFNWQAGATNLDIQNIVANGKRFQ